MGSDTSRSSNIRHCLLLADFGSFDHLGSSKAKFITASRGKRHQVVGVFAKLALSGTPRGGQKEGKMLQKEATFACSCLMFSSPPHQKKKKKKPNETLRANSEEIDTVNLLCLTEDRDKPRQKRLRFCFYNFFWGGGHSPKQSAVRQCKCRLVWSPLLKYNTGAKKIAALHCERKCTWCRQGYTLPDICTSRARQTRKFGPLHASAYCPPVQEQHLGWSADGERAWYNQGFLSRNSIAHPGYTRHGN